MPRTKWRNFSNEARYTAFLYWIWARNLTRGNQIILCIGACIFVHFIILNFQFFLFDPSVFQKNIFKNFAYFNFSIRNLLSNFRKHKYTQRTHHICFISFNVVVRIPKFFYLQILFVVVHSGVVFIYHNLTVKSCLLVACVFHVSVFVHYWVL